MMRRIDRARRSLETSRSRGWSRLARSPSRSRVTHRVLLLASLLILSATPSCSSDRTPLDDLRVPAGVDENAAGLYFFEQGDLESAAWFLNDAIRAAESEDNRRTVADARFNLGLVLRELGRPADAVVELGLAEELYRELDLPVSATRAGAALAAGDADRRVALKSLLRVLESCPPGARGEVRIEVASTHLALGDPQRARDEAEDALIEVGGDAYLRGDALFVLGRSRGRCGEFDAARAALAEVLALDKQHGRRRAISRTLLALAEVEDLAGDQKAAAGLRARADAVNAALP